MKPKNFPARKLLRQLSANERKRVSDNRRAYNIDGADATMINRTLTAADELNQLRTARDVRTKKYRGQL